MRYVAPVRELWPEPTDDLDIGARLSGDARPRPTGRPWVTLVMISSIDGAVAVDGVSAGLGAPSDHRRFVAARRRADAIIVGSGTVEDEDYRPAASPIAVLTRSLSLDPTRRLFGDPAQTPLLYTTDQAARTRGAAFDGVAEVIALGDSVDATTVLADLDRRGMHDVVLEGGPTINSLFLEADVVDEVLMSFAPLMVGGDGPRITDGGTFRPARRFVTDRVLLADDIVFVRYLRDRTND